MTCKAFSQHLSKIYPYSEANAIARLVFETLFSFSFADICAGKDEFVDDSRLQSILERLLKNEPVQYVLGRVDFCGHMFFVRRGVLIPRPETEELVGLATRDFDGGRILDCCTGSGCIAISLALAHRDAIVDAFDISSTALEIAKENANALGAKINFSQNDALNFLPSKKYKLIIANPPYVCMSERGEMSQNVLDYEPEEALFVPDDDALIFYRAISTMAKKSLESGGRLLFEINPRFVSELKKMLLSFGFSAVKIKDDAFGKPRFIISSL